MPRAGSDRAVTLAAKATAARMHRRPRRSKLTTLVREQLLADIRSGRLRPGDRLPTEIGLMARFGVSRAPIREAMQSLHLLGVVDISPRRGTKIRALPVESVVDLAILSGVMGQDHAIADVFEFRDAMESTIAELAARNASDAQIESIRQIIEENAAAVARGNRREAQLIDVHFHAKIAEASGNAVFKAVAGALNGLFAELRRMIGVIPGASEAAFAEHQEIFAAIARRDGPAARRATERHIRNTQARYESARSSGPRDDKLPPGDRRGLTARSRRIEGSTTAGPSRKRRRLA